MGIIVIYLKEPEVQQTITAPSMKDQVWIACKWSGSIWIRKYQRAIESNIIIILIAQ